MSKKTNLPKKVFGDFVSIRKGAYYNIKFPSTVPKRIIRIEIFQLKI
jgi:hypothetical protein